MSWTSIQTIDSSLRGKLVRFNNTLTNGKQKIAEGSIGICYAVKFISISVGFNNDTRIAPSRFTTYNSFVNTIDVTLMDISKLQVEDSSMPGLYYMPDGIFVKKVDESQDVYIDGRPVKLPVPFNELIEIAATAYGESSVGYDIEKEVFAIANTMVNYKKLTGKYSKAYAQINNIPNYRTFKSAINEITNGRFSQKGISLATLQKGIAAAINAVTEGTDYSNRATHWAGNDIGSKSEKWSETLKFTKPEHDLFDLGDNLLKEPHKEYWIDQKGNKTKVRGAYTYKWESTAAFGIKGKTGTTFLKVSDDYKKAEGMKGQ